MKQYSALIVASVSVILVLVALVVIKEANIYYPVKITTTQASDFVITGEGQVDVTPDTAYLELGITVLNEVSAEEARNKINQANNKIIEAATQNGIAKEDIKTSNYNIAPREQFTREGTPTATTYYGNANISIKTKDLTKAQDLTQILTQAGANSVNVRFGVDDPNKYREEARNKAIENAKKQAKELADNLDIRLGKVTNAVEGNVGVPPIMMDTKAMNVEGMGGASAPIFEPGTQTITTSVTLYFEKL